MTEQRESELAESMLEISKIIDSDDALQESLKSDAVKLKEAIVVLASIIGASIQLSTDIRNSPLISSLERDLNLLLIYIYARGWERAKNDSG